MMQRRWEKKEVRTVLHRLHTDLCDLTRTWPENQGENSGEEMRLISMRLMDEGNMSVRVKTQECSGEINQARADLGEAIRRLFGARNFGIISDDVYEIFRDRCKCCLRMLNGLESSLDSEAESESSRAFRLERKFEDVSEVRQPALQLATA